LYGRPYRRPRAAEERTPTKTHSSARPDVDTQSEDPQYADLSRRNVTRLVESLPDSGRMSIRSAADDAKAIACLVLELIDERNHLVRAVTHDIEPELEGLNNGGGLINAVTAAAGLRPVDEVLGSIGDASGGAGNKWGQPARRRLQKHAREHRRNVGLPIVVGDIREHLRVQQQVDHMPVLMHDTAVFILTMVERFGESMTAEDLKRAQSMIDRMRAYVDGLTR
jgi:hypothetical protein